MKVRIAKIDPRSNVSITKYQSEGAAGFDLASAEDRAVTLGPGNKFDFHTGLKFEIPEGFEVQVRPRSGLANKKRVGLHFGTIDSDYRGEIIIPLTNHSKTDVTISPGDRIAQGVLAPVVRAEFELVDTLTPTQRGSGGFGSTGN